MMKPGIMLRLAYTVGCGYMALCGVVLLRTASSQSAPPLLPPQPLGPALPAPRPALPAPGPAGPSGWFAGIRARCNAVEVEVALRGSPPPAGDEGAAYMAGCYALAGKMEKAKQTIDAMPAGGRPRAADIVFEIVHPVADAGDDRSAGPMMRLVLDYRPDNFMALYHAGMSEHAVGDNAPARKHLMRFLELYGEEDGWKRNAREVLARPEVARAR